VTSTGNVVTRQPRLAIAFIVLSTASCSMPQVIRCLRPDASNASAAPRMAMLSASVPPAVKTISDASADKRAETEALASSRAALAC
jgi:hypothetical protein